MGVIMSDSFKGFQRDFVTFAKKQAAEIEAVRALLRAFLARLLAAPKKVESRTRSNLAPLNRGRIDN